MSSWHEAVVATRANQNTFSDLTNGKVWLDGFRSSKVVYGINGPNLFFEFI